MPTIIESLLFEIGIDTKKLGGDAKEVETHLRGVEDRSHKAVQELEERGKQSGSMFKGLKEEAGGFFAMIAGAYSAQKIAGMSKDIMLNAESLGMMSSNLGMATERLKTWQLAAEKNGGSTGSMNGLLNQAAMVAAATKRGEDFAGSQEFFGLGGKREDLQSSESYLMAVSRIVKAQYAQSEQAGLYSANALSVPPDLVFLLKQGPDAIRAILREQEKYANVSESWAKSSHETMNSFRNIGDSMTKIGTIMLESVNPELRKAAEYAERAAAAMTTAEGAAQVKQETSHGLTAAARQVAARAAGLVPGAGMLGKLASGPIGQTVGFLADPDSTVSEAQEAEAMRQWQAEHAAGGGDLAARQKRLADKEKEYGLPSGVLDALWAQESGRGKNMLSPAGAEGHFQFMPATRKAYGDFDPNDFDQSSDGAARYMRDLLKQHNGDIDAALRWYNAGGNYRGSQAGKYADEVQERMQNSQAGKYADEVRPSSFPKDEENTATARPGPSMDGYRESKGQFAEPAPNQDLQDILAILRRDAENQPAAIVNYVEQFREKVPLSSSTSNRTDIQVNGPITIQTQSTDPEGIKKEFADTMGSYSNIASMAETGTH